MNGSSASSMDGGHMNGSIKPQGMGQMAVSDHGNLDNMPRHRPLTLMRAIRGILCLVIFLGTAFLMLVYWAPLATLLLRLVSVHYSRKVTSALFGTWLSLWPFLFEKINKTQVIFSGETVPEDDRVLLFANHTTEVDWMYIWDLALRKGKLGYIKYVLKRSLMKLPIFSWGFHIFEFIPVERKWECDEPLMRKKLESFKDPCDPLWLAVFPEGTDYTEEKCIKGQQYSAENGLPILMNVLVPKTKGFYSCLEILRSSLDAVYDITIGYKHRCPVFLDNVFGVDPSEVHIHVQRISLGEVPTSEIEAAAWLVERFRIKDQLLSEFKSLGRFPHQGTEGELSMLACVLTFTTVLALTGLFVYLTLSSFWFRVYVALSATYLTVVTYYDIQPVPVLELVKAFLCKRKTL